MAKLDLTIPKGYKCKNGVCEQDLELEIDVPEIKPIVSRLAEVEIKGFNQVQESKPQIVEKEIEKIVKVVPSWQPNFICKGPSCSTKKNPAYTSRPKGVCANCGQCLLIDTKCKFQNFL